MIRIDLLLMDDSLISNTNRAPKWVRKIERIIEKEFGRSIDEYQITWNHPNIFKKLLEDA